MAFCHVLAIRIFFEQNIHALTHEDGRRDTVLLGSLALVLSIETINDITHIIYRDDTLVLRETHIISLRLVLQVIEPGKTLQVVDVATEVDIILYVDTITLRTHDTAIPFSQSQTTKPSVSRHTILRQHFPVAYTIQHLDIAVSPRREIHAALALVICKAAILGEIHIGTRVRSCLRTLAVFEYELTLLVSDDFLHIEVSSKETFMQNEVAVIQCAFSNLICTMGVIYIGIDTAADISHLQRSVIVSLKMKRDDALLGIYTLDGSIAIRIPLFCLGYRDFVEDKLRSRDKLTDEQAVHLCVTIIIDTCAGTISSGNEIVCHEGIEFRQSLVCNLALSVSKLQPFQQGYHIL